MTNHIIVFWYQSMTDMQLKQVREMNSRYVTKIPVISVDETYHYIGVASEDENVFEEVMKAIRQLKIAGLRTDWLDVGEDETESPEQKFLADKDKFDTGKIN